MALGKGLLCPFRQESGSAVLNWIQIRDCDNRWRMFPMVQNMYQIGWVDTDCSGISQRVNIDPVCSQQITVQNDFNSHFAVIDNGKWCDRSRSDLQQSDHVFWLTKAQLFTAQCRRQFFQINTDMR